MKHLFLILLLAVSGVVTWLVLDSTRAPGTGSDTIGDAPGDPRGRPGDAARGTRAEREGLPTDEDRPRAARGDARPRDPGTPSAADAPDLVVHEERGEAGTALEGAVLAASGSPLADAVIRILHSDGDGPIGMTRPRLIREPLTTGADGTFRFDELLGGNGYVVQVEHGAYATAEREAIEVPPGQVIRLPDLRMGSGASITGFVLRKSGEQGVEGAVVAVRPAGTDESPLRQALTDEDGYFRLPNLAPGAYEVVASAQGFSTQRSETIHLASASDERRTTLRLGLGHAIRGAVRLPDGTPFPEAVIDVLPVGNSRTPPQRTTSRRSGAFVAEGLPEGDYLLRARAPGYHCPDSKASTGDREVALTLVPSPGVSGYVVAKGSGEPLKAFGVQVWAVGNRDMPSHKVKGEMLTFRSQDGSFTIEDLEPGRYSLKVFHNDYRPTWSEAFDLRRVYVHGLTVEMEPGATLHGVVLDERDQPLSGAKVSLLENTYRETPIAGLLYGKEAKLAAVRSDADGAFEFDRLVAGIYQLRVEAEGLVTLYHRDVPVVDDEENDAGALRMSVGGTVVVSVFDARGVAATGATVSLSSAAGDHWDAVVNAAGEAVFERVPSGSYDVRVLHSPPGQAGSVLAAGINAERTKQTITVQSGVAQKVHFDVP